MASGQYADEVRNAKPSIAIRSCWQLHSRAVCRNRGRAEIKKPESNRTGVLHVHCLREAIINGVEREREKSATPLKACLKEKERPSEIGAGVMWCG